MFQDYVQPTRLLRGPFETQTSLADASLLLPHPGNGFYGYAIAAIDDIDGDGGDEIVWIWEDGNNSAILYIFSGASTGSLTIEDAITSLSLQTDIHPSGYEPPLSADFDGDGRRELALLTIDQGPIIIDISTTGTMSITPLYLPSIGGTPKRNMRSGDVNGDGIADLLLPIYHAAFWEGYLDSRDDVPISNYPGAAALWTGPIEEFVLPDFWVYGSGYEIGGIGEFTELYDVNGDGLDDILISQSYSSYIQYLSGMISALTSPFEYTMFDADWPHIWDATYLYNGSFEEERLSRMKVLDDITGDGHPEIYMSGAAREQGWLLHQHQPGHTPVNELAHPLSIVPSSLQTIPDINGDGVFELLVRWKTSDSQPADLAIFFGDAP